MSQIRKVTYLLNEEWKELTFNTKYKISNYGRIMNNRGWILKQQVCKKGYKRIRLEGLDGIRKTIRVHRLVAIEFVDNPNKLPQVNHIDGNKKNNHFSNLEWCDNSANQLHANKTGLNKNRINKTLLVSSKPVVHLSASGQILGVYFSARQAEKCTGISYKMISQVCNGNCKTANGTVFEFISIDKEYLIRNVEEKIKSLL